MDSEDSKALRAPVGYLEANRLMLRWKRWMAVIGLALGAILAFLMHGRGAAKGKRKELLRAGKEALQVGEEALSQKRAATEAALAAETLADEARKAVLHAKDPDTIDASKRALDALRGK